MARLRIDIEYDGASFNGWAAQPGLRTVEGELRAALARVLGDDLTLRVAGRTDTGVHARGQVVSVATATVGVEPARLARALAGLLPPDLAARSVTLARDDFDARRDALSRRYEYRVLVGERAPLRRARALHHPRPLDIGALRAAAAAVRGVHDFRAFTPTQTQHVHFARRVIVSDWEERRDELVYVIAADAFLRHMVRVLVGTMLLVGRGAWTVARLKSLLAGGPRAAAGPTAPAHALTLVAVAYPGSLRPDA